jgi:hypothetical protein
MVVLLAVAPLSVLAAEVAIIYLGVGAVRAWNAYLGVSTARVLGCLVVSGFAGGLVNIAILVAAGAWRGTAS